MVRLALTLGIWRRPSPFESTQARHLKPENANAGRLQPYHKTCGSTCCLVSISFPTAANQLDITNIQQIDMVAIVVHEGSIVDNGTYRYPCSNVSSTFKKNVTLELQVTCGAAPELSADDRNAIGFAYVTAYNSLRSTVCDPFNLEVTSAKVVEIGDLRAGGTSLPLKIEVAVVCYGCDPLYTTVYGLPEFSSKDETTGFNESRRHLEAPSNDLKTRRYQEEQDGTCTCNSTLPRRPPLEADVTDALDLSFAQQEDLLLPCIGNTTTCDFGTSFTASALLEVQDTNGTLDPVETAKILERAYINTLDRLIGGGNATMCNALFGLVTDTEVYLDFVYNSVDRTANERERRQLQDLPSVAPTADSTFTFSWSFASEANTSDAPTAAPTIQVVEETGLYLLDAFGVCNGCPSELIFNNAADGRRRIDRVSSEEPAETSSTEIRFLQDIIGEELESDCFCPIGSVQIVTDFEQISWLEIIQEEVAMISNITTVTGAVSGLTRVDCVDQTPFSTTINFAFSAFEWVVSNEGDVQGLGDAIANVYKGLVEDFCDEYFRNSISLTYVPGSLQRSTVTGGQRHDRDLQSMQGCLNFRATFSVVGLCRGCQALGTPIPIFGNSTINRKLDEFRRPSSSSQLSKNRRLQDAGSTCICDSTSISRRAAPSLGAVRAELKALIPDVLPWMKNPTICGLPVQVEVPCPTIPTGPSITVSWTFYARRSDDRCLKAADLQQIAIYFSDGFNSVKQLESYPCEPEYLQVSNVIIDQSALDGCRRRRELLRGDMRADGREPQSDKMSRELRRDFDIMVASMTVTGNIYATNINAILAGEGHHFRATAAGIAERSEGVFEIETGRATSSPSAFPSAFPSEFPSEFPTITTQGDCDLTSQSCTGTSKEVQEWCDLLRTNGEATCCYDELAPPTSPCSWAGEGTIFRGSCNGPNACLFAPSTASIIVGAGSCNGENACEEIAPNEGISIVIGGGSCIGDRACKWIATNKGISVSIEPDSCIGTYACFNFAHHQGASVSIGTGACQGYEACGEVAYFTGTSISVGAGSCMGDFACSGTGGGEEGQGTSILSIGINSCIGEGSCSSIAAVASTSISIGSRSCQGFWACGQVAVTEGTEISIGSDSCLGDGACEVLGVNMATIVTIGDRSCTDINACSNVGYYQATSVDILDSACTASCSGSCNGFDLASPGDVQCGVCTCSVA